MVILVSAASNLSASQGETLTKPGGTEWSYGVPADSLTPPVVPLPPQPSGTEESYGVPVDSLTSPVATQPTGLPAPPSSPEVLDRSDSVWTRDFLRRLEKQPWRDLVIEVSSYDDGNMFVRTSLTDEPGQARKAIEMCEVAIKSQEQLGSIDPNVIVAGADGGFFVGYRHGAFVGLPVKCRQFP